MLSRRTWVGALAAAALAVTMLPAHAQNPPAPLAVFGVSVIEGPGTITNLSSTVYNTSDPLWQQCKPLLEAIPEPPGQNQLPAPLNGGVFFPCFGPPITKATTHFKAEKINPTTIDPVASGSFCASTLGPCVSESTGVITGARAGGLQAGAYCGSSKGTSVGSFATLNDPGSPLGNISYTYQVAWEQSAATILPLVGKITSGPSAGAPIVGWVSSRTTSNHQGTCGRPSTSAPASGQVTFAVDGMAVSFCAQQSSTGCKDPRLPL